MSEEPIFCADVYAELVAELGEEDVHDLLHGFLTETAARIAELAGGAPRGEMRRYAHSLKSTAATFGFMRLAGAAKELEALAETASAPELHASIARLAAASDECSALAGAQL